MTFFRPSYNLLIKVSVVESSAAVAALAAGGVVVRLYPAPLLLLVLLRLVMVTVVVLRRRPTATTARRFGQVDADGLDAARILEDEAENIRTMLENVHTLGLDLQIT